MGVKTFDDGSKSRPFGHYLVAGVDRAPLKCTKVMSKKKITKRNRVKPFVKYVNFNHMMPTRYQIPADIDSKALVNDTEMETADGKKEAKKRIKKLLQEKFVQPPADKSG